MIKKCITGVRQKANKVAPYLTAAYLAFLMMNTYAFADQATELFELIIKIIANLIIALGAILGIMGLVHYASAHSEGDGPAKNKAMGQIAAAIMLVALSILLKATASQFAGLISTSI